MANNELILAVDDEAHILELLSFNLEASGYRVVTAATGEDALVVCAHERPTLVLLDIMLPGIDGMEVCRRLKSQPTTADIPIIMLTAKGDEVDKILGLELGADDYITKPFSVRELIARVKALLRRAAPEEPENHTHRRGQQKQDEPDELIRKLTWFIVDMHRKEQRADLYDAVGQRQILLHKVGDGDNKADLHRKQDDDQHDPQRRRNAPLALLLNLESLHRSLSPLLLAVPCF